MFLAHGPISYILNESIQKKNISNLSKQEHVLVMFFSILFGILPDIDLALLSMTNIPPFQHHLLITHSLILYLSFWVILNMIFWILKKILNKESRKVFRDELLNVIQWSFLIGTLSHFAADLLFSYSRTFFPINRQFTILGDIFSSNYFAGYIFSVQFATEVLLVGIFLLMVYRKYLKNKIFLNIFLYSLISISSVFLLLSIYMNLNTYNKAFIMENGKKVLDMDYDGIQDRYDTDTNNNGIKNIYELDREKAVTFVQSISSEQYMATNSKDTFGKIKYLFGAFNSYRLISQTFYEQNLPIEPVLREYYATRNSLTNYDTEILYPQNLYLYLSEYGEEKEYEDGRYTGEIFFVLEQSEVVNMGLILSKNSFGIVLDNDKKLIPHSLNEILDYYSNAEIKVLSIE